MLKTGLKLMAGLLSGTLVLGSAAMTTYVYNRFADAQNESDRLAQVDVWSDADVSSADAGTEDVQDHSSNDSLAAAADEDAEEEGTASEASSSAANEEHSKNQESSSDSNADADSEDAVTVVSEYEHRNDSIYEAEEDEDVYFLDAESFGTQDSDVSEPGEETEITGLEDASVHLHSLYSGFITPELTGKYSEEFLTRIRNGETKLYYTGSSEDADFSLSEIVSFYCSMPEGIRYFEVSDASGTYLELEEPEAELMVQKVKDADAGWQRYADYILESAEQMELYSSDRDLVNQINAFICRNYDYEVTNSGMPVFISTGKGQCWHYAKMFADLCKTVGIPAWKVESDTHAWDQVLVDGVTYTFDPTFNDTGHVWTAYSWMKD